MSGQRNKLVLCLVQLLIPSYIPENLNYTNDLFIINYWRHGNCSRELRSIFPFVNKRTNDFLSRYKGFLEWMFFVRYQLSLIVPDMKHLSNLLTQKIILVAPQ